MSIRGQAVRGSVLLTMAEGLSYACSFVRSMILARLLTKADFGIAATFAIIISLLELSAKMGLSRCIIRDRDGNDAGFVSAAHVMQFGVATLSAVIIVIGSWPLSRLFGIPEHVWAVASLGFIALLRGCEHIDVRRFERNLRFAPSSLSELIPQAIITLAAWPVATWLRDYRAVLVLLLAKSAIGCACTHVFAERRYRWSLRRDYLQRLLQFGWPLVINGFVMFGVMQGEQFAVATFYNMADLAPYAAAATLALMPVFFMSRLFSSVLLPVLARVEDIPDAFRRRYRQVLALLACVAGSCSVGLILGGESIMRVVYGPKYAGAGILLAGLAAAGALRTVRAATALAALARGDTRNELYSNGFRLIGLVPATAMALAHQPLAQIAYCGVLGELAACGISIIRLRNRDSVPAMATITPVIWVILLMSVASLGVLSGAHDLPTVLGLATAALAATVSAVALVALLPELRYEARAVYHRATTLGLSGMLPSVRSLTAKEHV